MANITSPAKRPGILQRAKQAIRYTITGVDGAWMGPNQPLQPMATQTKGRVWDYPISWNLNYIPRATEPISFQRLRLLAENCAILRTVIETRKDQMEALHWTINPRELRKGKRVKGALQETPKMKAIREFFQTPDGRLDWTQWLRALLEQHFVYDAVAIERVKNRGGQLGRLQILDGATIKVLINADGMVPLPPDPAYQQVLKGLPTSDYTGFTTGELLYYPKNTRVDRMYGYSPVEQIITYVDMSIQRTLSQLSWFTEGNVPAGLVEAPPEMSPDQITVMQQIWDSQFGGNVREREQALWVPNGTKFAAIKDKPVQDEFDEWLARVICFAFSISPQPFVKMMNRATAGSAQETAAAEGLQPTQEYVKRLMDKIIAEDFQSPELEFDWDQDIEFDPSKKAVIDNLYARSGIKSIDEIRDTLGLDPRGGAFDEPMIATANGYIPVDPQDAQDMKTEAATAVAAAKPAPVVQNPGSAPTDGGEGKTVPTAPGKAAGKQPPGQGNAPTPGKQGPSAAQKAASAPLFVRRMVLNAPDIAAWALSQGICTNPDELHVTIMYSLLPVDQDAIGRAGQAPLLVIEGGARSVERFDDDAVVLRFDSDDLAARWAEFIGAGAGWSYDDYRPHITIASDPDIDVSTIEPYTGPILLGPEEFHRIGDDGFAKISGDDVDTAASETELNPTQAQIEAGNYKKGHIVIQGLDISIENEAGSTRSGIGPDGTPWSVTMPTHYGYIKRTEGADGDHVDVYLGPNPEWPGVYVIDQVDADTGEFDEHKAFIGYQDWTAAQKDYLAAFSDGKGHMRIGGVSSMSMDEFKQWLADGDQTEPVAAQKTVTVGTGLTHHDQGAATFEDQLRAKQTEIAQKIYDSVSDLPKTVKDKIKSARRRRQWMLVFNSILRETGDESRAFAGAWARTKAAGGVKKSS